MPSVPASARASVPGSVAVSAVVAIAAFALCFPVASACADEVATMPVGAIDPAGAGISTDPSAIATESRASWAPAAGALTAVVPLAVGGAFLAHDHQPNFQRAGIAVIVSGFAVAPWVAYGLEHRWRRALVFGLTSVAASAGTLVAMHERDPFDPTIGNHNRLAFGTLLTTAFFAATFGVIDSFIAGPAPRER